LEKQNLKVNNKVLLVKQKSIGLVNGEMRKRKVFGLLKKRKVRRVSKAYLS